MLLGGAAHARLERDSTWSCPPSSSSCSTTTGCGRVIDACVACGRTDELVAFDLLEGGVLCREHRRGVPLSPDALALLQEMLGGRLAVALAEPTHRRVEELDQLATRTIEIHLERRLKSVGLI